jgi:SH3-like domain-containing protein
MSKVEKNPVRHHHVVTRESAHEKGNSRKLQVSLALLILAGMALWLSTDYSWAQLQEGEQVVTVANAYWVRLRSTPDIRPDTILTRVAGGIQLRHLGRQGDWFKVELPNGSEGWLNARFGRLDTARDLLEVSASVARIRDSQALDAPVVGRDIQGIMLDILDKEEEWYLVRLPMGEEGWIRSDMVTLHAVEPLTAKAENVSDDSQTVEDNNVAEAADSQVDPTGINVLEISPLPIPAAAEEVLANSAPALRSHQNPDKPRFLLLFISVVAGLSAFTVLLIVGAAAIRRKAESVPLQEPPETDTPSSADDEGSDKTYSDPLLKWMGERPSRPAGNGHEWHDSESDSKEEPEISTLPVSSERPVQTTAVETVSPLSDGEEKGEEPEVTSPVDDSPPVSAAAVETSKPEESEESTRSRKRSKSSRSRRRRNRRKRSSSRKSKR